MGKIAIFIFLLLLGALGFFAIENNDAINIKVPFGDNYIFSKVAFLILSSTIGALSVLIIFFVRDSKKAIENLKSAKKQKKEAKIQEYDLKASNAILSHKEEDAKNALNDILRVDPEHIQSYLKLGDIAFEHKDYNTATEYYKRSNNSSPSNLQALLSLEAVSEKMEHYDDALKYLNEILALDPENLTALYRKRSVFEKMQKWDDLLVIQESIIKLQKREKEKEIEQQKIIGYKYEYARASHKNGELEKAEKAFRALLKLDSGFMPVYIGLADILSQKGDIAEAINLLENAYEKLNSIVLLIRLDDLLINAGESDRLIRFYKNSILKNPYDNRLKFLLGRLYSRLQMVDDSLKILESLDNAISSPEFYVLRGELYLKRNQNPRALEYLEKALVMLRSCPPAYYCLKCGKKSNAWSGRCDECMEWNTYSLDVYGISKS